MLAVYPCLYGWKRFFSTYPNHWCKTSETPVQSLNWSTKESWVEINTLKYTLVNNDTDVPSEQNTNLFGVKYETEQ